MPPQSALYSAHRDHGASRMEEVQLPLGNRTGLQETLRRIYRPSDELPDDLYRLVDRLR